MRAAAAQVALAASRPAWPAAQLALPALMATTRTLPPVAREVLLVDDEGRGGDAVGGEGGGGAGGRVGDDEGKVGAAAGFEAGFDGAEAETAGNEESGKVSHLGDGVNPFNLAGGWGLADGYETGADGGSSGRPWMWTGLSETEFLELRQVNVARGDRVVLHDVNLTIRAGEHVAILGPNGCGKSTLILAMTCQIYPIVRPGMRVRIFGRERWDLTQLRKHFGVVGAGLMGAELPGERTAVTTGLDAVTAGFFSASTLWPNLHVTAEMRARAAEALERMEATHLGEQLVGTMSAGEKRRILIARALVHRPRQLLLDEPSNALDLAAQRELRETLRRLAQEGTGLVLVTHHLGDILPEIERMILMRDGRIVADGPRAELLTEARLSELFQAPVRIGRDEEWLHSW